MLGAIIGDIAGSSYEINNIKTKKFKFMNKKNSTFTDDTVMTIAVGKAILDCNGDYSNLNNLLIENMVSIGRNHSQCGFGGNFFKWIIRDDHTPYNSYGNGSAMRVSACGIVGNSIEEVKMLSKYVTQVSHNHPESFKAAEAISLAIYYARNGKNKEFIKKIITDNYYNIDFTLDDIRDSYKFNVSCQGCVPQAFEAFFESKSYVDAIRNAISIGGDSDTIAAITGSIAGAYYGIPIRLIKKAYTFFNEKYDSDLLEPLYEFEKKYPTKAKIF